MANYRPQIVRQIISFSQIFNKTPIVVICAVVLIRCRNYVYGRCIASRNCAMVIDVNLAILVFKFLLLRGFGLVLFKKWSFKKD